RGTGRRRRHQDSVSFARGADGGAAGNAFQQSQQTIYPAQASNPSGVYPNQSYNQQPPVALSQYPVGYNPNPYSNPQNNQTPPPAGNQNSQYSQDDNYRY
ncbi:MAG: hypothetical protein ACFN21_03655, partial [Candidatus Saccharibacteria bacterium]